jgi:hypothetical protein
MITSMRNGGSFRADVTGIAPITEIDSAEGRQEPDLMGESPREQTDRNLPPMKQLPKDKYEVKDSDERLLECKALCEKASADFIAACASKDPDSSEASMFSVIDSVDALWTFSDLRGRPFQDLVGLFDAALRGKAPADFSEGQRVALQLSFRALKRAFVAESDVAEIRDRFVDLDIDILRPIRRPPKGKGIRIVVGDET